MREAGGFSDVYQYTAIPNTLRVQIVHIWTSAYGVRSNSDSIDTLFQEFHDILCREYGIFNLTERRESYFDKLANFMIESRDTEKVLDVIEIVFKDLDFNFRKYYFALDGVSQDPDDAITELNARFREHGVGFQYESGRILRVDSQLIHTEVVKPALLFLSGKEFTGANQEFLSAHGHYREQKFKECLNDCLKAFESTMQSICAKRKWQHPPTATAKTLLDLLFQKDLIPSFMQSHFTGLRATLEAGVPTVRNKLGGHGQGISPVEVPEFVAAYALHLTATNILFLVQADKAIK